VMGAALRFPSVRLRVDGAVLMIPIIGTLLTYYNLANVSRTLSVLLRSGMRIPEALDLVIAGTRNLAYKRAIETLRRAVVEGQKIAPQLRSARRLFPSVCVQMIGA